MGENERKTARKAHCLENPEVQCSEFTDYKIGRVTYRVWSAYEGKREVVDSLSDLMLRRLKENEKPKKTD